MLPDDRATSEAAKKRLNRIIFSGGDLFTVPDVIERYEMGYQVRPDEDSVKARLGELVKAGYVAQNGERYGVALIPVENDQGV